MRVATVYSVARGNRAWRSLASAILVAAAACGGDAGSDAADVPDATDAAATDVAAAGTGGAAAGNAAPGCWTEADPASLADRPSPLDSASVELAAGQVKVCYGSPRMRDRLIMGGLVPFDQPWRTGANEATSLYVPAPATVAGVSVDAGRYSIYTIPGAERWEVVVNAEAERWGIPINADVRALDLGSGTVTAERIDAPAEEMTIALERTSETSADMVVEWETTRLRVPIESRASEETAEDTGQP